MIIGLCGRKGCGKSSFADYAVELGLKKLSFASPIKNALEAMGVDEVRLNDPDLKERPTSYVFGGLTPRRLMQLLGTEFGRNLVSNSIWIDHLIERMRGMGGDDFIIDDVRFDNEAEAIKLEGGIIVEVIRDDSFYSKNDTHISEHGVSTELIDEQFDNKSCYSMDFKIGVEHLLNKIEVERLANV
jgi:hypothetical protein